MHKFCCTYELQYTHCFFQAKTVDSNKRVWDTSVLSADVLAGPYSILRSWNNVKVMEHCQCPEKMNVAI